MSRWHPGVSAQLARGMGESRGWAGRLTWTALPRGPGVWDQADTGAHSCAIHAQTRWSEQINAFSAGMREPGVRQGSSPEPGRVSAQTKSDPGDLDHAQHKTPGTSMPTVQGFPDDQCASNLVFCNHLISGDAMSG